MRDGGDNGGVSCPDTTVRFQKICDQCAKGDSRGQVGEVTAKTDSKSHQAEDKEREIVALQEEEGGGQMSHSHPTTLTPNPPTCLCCHFQHETSESMLH